MSSIALLSMDAKQHLKVFRLVTAYDDILEKIYQKDSKRRLLSLKQLPRYEISSETTLSSTLSNIEASLRQSVRSSFPQENDTICMFPNDLKSFGLES